MYWGEPGGKEGKSGLVQNSEEQGNWSFIQVRVVFFQTCHRRSGSRQRLGVFLNLRPSAAIDTQTHTQGHSGYQVNFTV